MKKYFATALLLSFSFLQSLAQVTPDSIARVKAQLTRAGSDTARILLLLKVGGGKLIPWRSKHAL